jgi:hypothetical protein
VITAAAAEEPSPRYQFAEPSRGEMCERMTADMLARRGLFARTPWLSETRDDTVPLSSITINLEGRTA